MTRSPHEASDLQANVFRALIFEGETVRFVVQTPTGDLMDMTWKNDAEDNDIISSLMETYEPKLFHKMGVGASFVPSGDNKSFEPDK